MEIKQRLLPDGKPNKPSRPMKPAYFTIHNTDNTSAGATAEAHSRFVLNGSGGAQKSWHYTVDDCAVFQHLRDNEQGWHAGDRSGPGNTASIGIEVCMLNGLVTVPVRTVAEALDAKVGWTGQAATVNGKVIVGSQTVKDTSYAPVREIVEAAGGKVIGWDGLNRKVSIRSN